MQLNIDTIGLKLKYEPYQIMHCETMMLNKISINFDNESLKYLITLLLNSNNLNKISWLCIDSILVQIEKYIVMVYQYTDFFKYSFINLAIGILAI